MGVNKIDPFMKKYGFGIRIGCRRKKVNQPFGEKTLVKKLKASNQPRSAISGVADHTSERLLAADYEEAVDEAEQRQISSIISSPVGEKVQNFRPVLFCLPIQHNHAATQACPIAVSHFHGCQVTINYGAGVGVFNKAAIKRWTLEETY